MNQPEPTRPENAGHGNPFKPGFTPSTAVLKDIGPDISAGIIADKELRRDLDAQLQKLKGLLQSRERSLAITKLQECILWLGMDLKRLNDARPYPNSYDPTNTIVEPTADSLKL